MYLAQRKQCNEVSDGWPDARWWLVDPGWSCPPSNSLLSPLPQPSPYLGQTGPHRPSVPGLCPWCQSQCELPLVQSWCCWRAHAMHLLCRQYPLPLPVMPATMSEKQRKAKKRKATKRKEKKRKEKKRKEKKRKDKTTRFGVNLMRSQVLYRAAQSHHVTYLNHTCCWLVQQW